MSKPTWTYYHQRRQWQSTTCRRRRAHRSHYSNSNRHSISNNLLTITFNEQYRTFVQPFNFEQQSTTGGRV
ncbi:hypothetical protein O0I10_005751 [Lichtheimia ornata]|uniref:Uncharacterized protein n=1 Tax=Lichtheimia ornata TaxID=688661 RepID=A0AAD7XVB6_9FUNG|nr:uncharacterized protein O0I10_005751 [Lichtheimia ornata]KAJ8658399.1 hypothetical protein O0I10_005751 [Lichtheimia ornata]